MQRVLVIDDEAAFLRALDIILTSRGYEVRVALTGEEGLVDAADHPPDVVVLDLGLPGIPGLDVLRALRGWTTVPVVVLSARHSEEAKVEALDAGADDFVTKPFSINELMARLRAALRRHHPADEELPFVATPDFTIDLAAKRIRLTSGDDVHLTPTEWRVVEVLARNQGRLVSRSDLLLLAWGPGHETQHEYLRTYLRTIRQKLEPDPAAPRYFLTERRMGYRFVDGTEVR